MHPFDEEDPRRELKRLRARLDEIHLEHTVAFKKVHGRLSELEKRLGAPASAGVVIPPPLPPELNPAERQQERPLKSARAHPSP